MLSAATDLSPELKAYAAALAPAIRSSLRRADGSYDRFTFAADPSLTTEFFNEMLSDEGRDGFLLGDTTEPLETLYSRLADQTSLAAGGDKPMAIGVIGLGVFTATTPSAAAAISATATVAATAATAAMPSGRLSGKVAIVTGSAQGFGEGIAREMAAQGALVAIADLNEALAEKVAGEIRSSCGEGSAIALKVDVGNEASIERLMADTVLSFGGLDILISNAGVLKAGGLEEMDLPAFEFVTRINYTAFFLCTKYAARIMRLQHRFDPDWYGDIIQINSKSGLEGSNRNFAYAGGKFGGIGLVQSFAKELVDQNIKVNAVCPGNYYEGPLWSDPERGLFVQYLRTGKVPGAKTVQDVYDFYVSKVPMKKGCSPRDVARAIYYLVEQTNETGQALPVTGGQNMLH